MPRTKIQSLVYQGEPLIDIRGHWEPSALDDLIRAFQAGMEKVAARLFLRIPDLDYLDSAAMGVIMLHMREMSQRQAKLVLLQPSLAIRHALRTVSLEGLLEIQE